MVFSSPWLTTKKETGSPLQTALVCNSNPLMVARLPKQDGIHFPCSFWNEKWLVQDQTVLGKDNSNLLIADSLLKTIWFINAPWYCTEALASPQQTACGKDFLKSVDSLQFTKNCMVIDSPYYFVYEELASPEQTATGKDMSNPLYGRDGLPKTIRVFQFTLDSRSETLDWVLLHQ
ncbi:hypothetical protein Tco_0238789, partial [Tanacetum coccineum]